MSFTNVIHVVKNGDLNDIEQLCHKPGSLLVISLFKVHTVHRCHGKQRGIFKRGRRTIIQTMIPQASGCAANGLMLFLSYDHITDDLIPRHVHLFHPRLDNVSQTLRQMGALSEFVDFAFQIRPQNVLHHFAYLGREEALPGVRLGAVRVLQPGERRVRAVGTEAQRDARPAPDRPPAARGCGRGLKRVWVEHPGGPPRVRLAELRGVVTVSHRGRPSFLPGRGMCVIIHHDMRCFFRHRCNWWLLDVPYWFKDSFLHQVLGIIST